MLRKLHLAHRFGVVIVPLALAAGLLPGQTARAFQNDLLRLAQADVGGFSQAQLEAYAAAVMTVQEIDRAWSPKIDQAETTMEAETLKAQATNEMIGGIEAQGLSVQEYNTITQAAEQDQVLYDHIMTLLAQAH